MLPALRDAAELRALLRVHGPRDAELEELCVADDRVEGRAYLVAHHGEELRLRFVRRRELRVAHLQLARERLHVLRRALEPFLAPRLTEREEEERHAHERTARRGELRERRARAGRERGSRGEHERPHAPRVLDVHRLAERARLRGRRSRATGRRAGRARVVQQGGGVGGRAVVDPEVDARLPLAAEDSGEEVVGTEGRVDEALERDATRRDVAGDPPTLVQRDVDQEPRLLPLVDLLHELYAPRGGGRAVVARALHRLAPRGLCGHVVADRGAVPPVERLEVDDRLILRAGGIRPHVERRVPRGAHLALEGGQPRGANAPAEADSLDARIALAHAKAVRVLMEIRLAHVIARRDEGGGRPKQSDVRVEARIDAVARRLHLALEASLQPAPHGARGGPRRERRDEERGAEDERGGREPSRDHPEHGSDGCARA